MTRLCTVHRFTTVVIHSFIHSFIHSLQVESGNEQLVSASRYQRKARKKMCILAIVLVIAAGVIALIIYVSVKK